MDDPEVERLRMGLNNLLHGIFLYDSKYPLNFESNFGITKLNVVFKISVIFSSELKL